MSTKQTSVQHEPTAPKTTYQKPQEEVRPGQPSVTPRESYRARSSLKQDIRTELNEELVVEINKLINLAIQSDYACHSIAYYFDRAEVGLYGVADFFRNVGCYKARKAKLLMDYLMVRGARLVLDDIPKPETTEWGTPLRAFEYLLSVQKNIYQACLRIYQRAEKSGDAHLTDFLEEFSIRPISLWIRRICVIISNLERAGSSLGVYQLNKHLCYNMQLFFETNKEITEFLDQ